MRKCKSALKPQSSLGTLALLALAHPTDIATSMSGSSDGTDETNCSVSFLAAHVQRRGRWAAMPLDHRVVST